MAMSFCSKWRTTPVAEEGFAEVLEIAAAVVAGDAVGAVAGAAVHEEANPKIRR